MNVFTTVLLPLISLAITVGVIALILAVPILIAKKFELIAHYKGYHDVHAFAMCFWLGIIGYLYVIALPNKNHEEHISMQQTEILKTLYELKLNQVESNNACQKTEEQ